MIEKLLHDKRQLSDQVVTLMEQIKTVDAKYSKIGSDLKAKFQLKMQNAKEQWMQSEKARREKWIEKKTKDIKDTTIRGLEPEIERMLSRGRSDKRKIEEEFEGKLKIEKDRVEKIADEKLSSLKEKLILENETLLTKEREYMQNRFQEQETKLKESFDEEIARLKYRRDEDLQRTEEIFKKEKSYLERKMEELRSENQDLERKIRGESEQETQDIS